MRQRGYDPVCYRWQRMFAFCIVFRGGLDDVVQRSASYASSTHQKPVIPTTSQSLATVDFEQKLPGIFGMAVVSR